MKTEELFELIDGIDDDIILDIPHLNAEKPIKLAVKKRAPFWSYIGTAAGLICVLAAGIFAMAKLQGGQPIGPGTSNAAFSDNDSNAGDPNSDNASNNSEISANKPFYDDVFEGISSDPAATGEPMTYDEIMDMITSPLQKENGIIVDSFYMVETIRALSDEEARKLNGWTELCAGSTIYEVKLLMDLISNDEVSRVERIIVAHGTKEWQHSGDPIYAPGERFTVVLTKPQKGCDYLQTPSSKTFRYDVVEDGSGTILYSRGSELDKLEERPSSVNIDEKVITGTTQNPAAYTQKIWLADLMSYLRTDWKQRRVSAHFENEPQTVDIGNGMTLTGTPLDSSELEEFSAEPYVSDYIMEKAEEEFLDSLEIPGLKDLCIRVYDLIGFSRCQVNLRFTSAVLANDRKRPYINNQYCRFYETGYTYESFYNEYLRTFTGETIEEMFEEYDVFLDYNGELFYSDGARGGWLGEVHREFELISKSDAVIEFRRITFHSDSDNKPAAEWIPELRNEYGIGITEFKFVLTEDGWRAANIPVEYEAEL